MGLPATQPVVSIPVALADQTALAGDASVVVPKFEAGLNVVFAELVPPTAEHAVLIDQFTVPEVLASEKRTRASIGAAQFEGSRYEICAVLPEEKSKVPSGLVVQFRTGAPVAGSVKFDPPVLPMQVAAGKYPELSFP